MRYAGAGNGRRSGQALVMVVLSLSLLFGVMGLAVDLGWGFYLKTRVQTAADAAATAAMVYAKNNSDSCSTVTCGTSYTCAGVTPPTTSLQAGCLYATTDGPPAFTGKMIEYDSTTSTGVSGNTPTLWIKATVSTTSSNLFLYGSGFHSATVAAQSIAGLTTNPGGACVYALSPTASPAVSVTGSSTLSGAGCGVFVKSTGAEAITVTGSSHITATSGSVISSDGGACSTATTGTCYVTPNCCSSSVSPAPVAGTVTDPFATLVGPTVSTTCDHTNYSLGNGHSDSQGPGVYCGGITVGGSATLNLSEGVYILNGGGLNVGNSGTLNANTGTGVMFYNTGVNGYSAAPITITGSGIVNLTAPTSGPYQGIAFFQDRSITYASHNSISNSGGGNVTGTYYFPTTSFDFTGNTATPVYAAFIAQTITISGSSYLKNDLAGTYTGLAKTTAALIQ